LRQLTKVKNVEHQRDEFLQIVKDWRPKTDMENAKEQDDNLAFVKLARYGYYSFVKAANRKYDKNT